MADLPHSADDAIQMERTVTVLTIGGSTEGPDSLRSILTHSNWRVHEANDCIEARRLLERQAVSVVVCEAELPDGDWKTVLRMLEAVPCAPPLIVTARNAEERLWAEVLNLGAYDLLPQPLDRKDVVRAVSIAWLHWRDSLVRLRRAATRSGLPVSPLS